MIASWSTAAGRWRSHAASSGSLPWLTISFASFPQVVVLPEPCSPAIMMIVGGGSDIVDLRVHRAHQLGQFVLDDLDHELPGCRLLMTSVPTAL